jgi:hypothetical protein
MASTPAGHQESVCTPPPSSLQLGSLQTARAARLREWSQAAWPSARLSAALASKGSGAATSNCRSAGAGHRAIAKDAARAAQIQPNRTRAARRDAARQCRTCRPSPPRLELPHLGPPPRQRPLGRGQPHPRRHPLGRDQQRSPDRVLQSAATAWSPADCPLHRRRAQAARRRGNHLASPRQPPGRRCANRRFVTSPRVEGASGRALLSLPPLAVGRRHRRR